jgi:hypothetical protein
MTTKLAAGWKTVRPVLQSGLEAGEPRHNMPHMLLLPETKNLAVAREHRLAWRGAQRTQQTWR